MSRFKAGDSVIIIKSLDVGVIESWYYSTSQAADRYLVVWENIEAKWAGQRGRWWFSEEDLLENNEVSSLLYT